jgi:hypothetical protein
MSRLAGFYIAKAMESIAGGTTTAAASRRPTRREGDHAAPNAVRTHGRSPSTSHRVAAAVHRFVGGLDRASRADTDWATFTSLRQSPHGSHQHIRRR